MVKAKRKWRRYLQLSGIEFEMVHLIDYSFNVCVCAHLTVAHSVIRFFHSLSVFSHLLLINTSARQFFMRRWFELLVCFCVLCFAGARAHRACLYEKKTRKNERFASSCVRSGIDIKIAFQQRFENWLISIRWMRTFMWISIVLQCFCHIQFNVFISLLWFFCCFFFQMALLHKILKLFLFQRNWRCRFNSVKWWNIQLSISLNLMPVFEWPLNKTDSRIAGICDDEVSSQLRNIRFLGHCNYKYSIIHSYEQCNVFLIYQNDLDKKMNRLFSICLDNVCVFFSYENGLWYVKLIHCVVFSFIRSNIR